MMATEGIIPSVFRRSSVATTYSYDDVAAGTGVERYYGTRAVTSAGSTYGLFSFISAQAGTAQAVVAGDGAVSFNLTAYNLPRVLRGTAYITGEINCSAACKVSFLFQKISSGTTNISSTIETDNLLVNRNIVVPIPLTTTNFSAGDNLRIVVTVTGGNAGEGLNIDNLDATKEPFTIYTPYKIDL